MMKVVHVETDVAGTGIAETEEGRVLVVFASYTLAVPYVYYYTRGCPPVYAWEFLSIDSAIAIIISKGIRQRHVGQKN